MTMLSLENRLKEADLPDDVRKKAESEFKKLKQMPASSSEASVVRGYVEWILDTPWNKASKVSINLDKKPNKHWIKIIMGWMMSKTAF